MNTKQGRFPFESQRFESISNKDLPNAPPSKLAFNEIWNFGELVYDKDAGHPAVLSCMRKNCLGKSARIRFERETRIFSEIECSHFLSPYAFAINDQWAYSATQDVDAESASDQEIVSFSIARIFDVALNVLDAISKIHQQNLTHRNIRTSTILIGQNQAWLSGIGPERFAEKKWLHSDQFTEISAFISPELAGTLERDVAPTSDLYSFGIFLFHLFAGKLPYLCSTAGETLFKHLTSDPPLDWIRSDAPSPIRKIIGRLLEKEPHLRYQSAESLAHDLKEIQSRSAAGEDCTGFVIGRSEIKSSISIPQFVGRQSELEQLATALEKIQGGETRNAIIACPSGLGKSRLIIEFIRHATKQGVTVLRCQGSNSTTQEPMKAINEIVEQLLTWSQTLPEFRQRLQQATSDFLPEIASLSMPLAKALGYSESDQSEEYHFGPEEFGQQRIEMAVCRLFSAVSSPTFPVLFWFDDCQWLDDQTRSILARFAHFGTSNILNVFSIRTDIPQVSERFVERIAPEHYFELEPLSTHEIGLLVESMAGVLPDEAIQAVVKHASGSPFMASAVLRGMVESDAITPSGDGWQIVPEKLAQIRAADDAADVLLQRLEKLPEDTLRCLSIAAIIGKEFAAESVVAISKNSDHSLQPFELARQKRLIWTRPDGQFSFAHDKIRETLIGRLTDTDRQRLHLGYAEFLEELEPDKTFDLAFHFDQGGVRQKALSYAMVSAEQARQQFSLNSAEQQLLIAVENLPQQSSDSELRYQIFSSLADVMILEGKYEYAGPWLNLAVQSAKTPFQIASIELTLGELEFKRGDKEAAVGHFEESLLELGHAIPTGLKFWMGLSRELAFQALHSILPRTFVGTKGNQPSKERKLSWRIYSRLAHGYWYTRDKYHTLWSHLRGMNLAERFGPTRELAQSYSEHAPALSLIPWHRRGIAYAQHSLEMREDLNDVWGQGQSRNFKSLVYYSSSEFRKSVAESSRAITILERTGDLWEVGIARYQRAASHYRQGNLRAALDEAQQTYRAALKVGDFQSTGNIIDVWVRAGLGVIPDEVIELENQRVLCDKQGQCQVALANGIHLLHTSRIDEAIDSFQQAIDISRNEGVLNTYISPNFAWFATALRHQLELNPPRTLRARKALLLRFLKAAKSATRVARKYQNELPHSLRELGTAYALSDRQRLAKKHLEASIRFAQHQNAQYEEAQSRQALGQFGLEFGWPDSADILQSANRELDDILGQVNQDENTSSLSLLDRFETLLESGRKIATSVTHDAIHEQTVEAGQLLLRGQRTFVLNVDPENRFQPNPKYSSISFDHTLFQDALNEGKPVISSVESSQKSGSDQERTGSYLASPIVVNDQVAAILYVANDLVEDLFGEDEKKIATYLSTAAGAAFQKAEGYQKLEHMNSNLEILVGERTETVEARSRELENTANTLRQTQIYLEEARDAAETANQSKSDFLARMSHEIRTPISAILGFTELLLNGIVSDPKEQHRKLGTIHASGEHLLGLINNLLDLSKIEADRMELEIIDCQPAKVAREVVETLATAANQKSIALTMRVEGKVPETIQSDPTRLRQIITNLVGNAIKFTSDGEVSLVLRYPHTEKSNNPTSMLIDVVDTGIGMTPEQASNIFDPFTQADTSTTRKFGGTGLGLSISKQLTEALGGEITVTSQPGVGSTFSISILTGDVSQSKMIGHDEAVADSENQLVRWDRMDLEGGRVLVVDDSETNRDFLSIVLHDANIDVVTCNDGQQAVDLLNNDRDFDIVFMDMQMPVLDGLSATKILRRQNLVIPIVALTANSIARDEQRCIDAGCSHYLSKPIDVSRLLPLTAELCSPSQRAERLERMKHSNGTEKRMTDCPGESQQATDRRGTSPSHGRNQARIAEPLDSLEEMFAELGVELVEKAHGRLPELDEALANKTAKPFLEVGHWLKGSAGTIGMNELATCGINLEKAAKLDDFEQTEQFLKELRNLLAEARAVNANIHPSVEI